MSYLDKYIRDEAEARVASQERQDMRRVLDVQNVDANTRSYLASVLREAQTRLREERTQEECDKVAQEVVGVFSHSFDRS